VPNEASQADAVDCRAGRENVDGRRESDRLAPLAGRGRRAVRAAGEGALRLLSSWRVPLTRIASPMQSDLSPQAGRGKGNDHRMPQIDSAGQGPGVRQDDGWQ